MYPILEKSELAEHIFRMKIQAPRIAHAALPGQFVIVRTDEFGERIPLTIAGYDAAEGSVTLVIQAIGASTRKICEHNAGDSLVDVAGPLGRPSEFVHLSPEELRGRRYLFVAGGVGTAPVYPQVKWLHEHGALTDVIIGAKTARMLIYTEAMRSVRRTSSSPPTTARRASTAWSPSSWRSSSRSRDANTTSAWPSGR